MSIYDREPHVPVTDTGKGLIVMGWMWLLGTAVFWFMHPRSMFVPISFEWLCASLGVIGIAVVLCGHLRKRLDRDVLTPRELEELREAKSHEPSAGNQVGTGEAA